MAVNADVACSIAKPKVKEEKPVANVPAKNGIAIVAITPDDGCDDQSRPESGGGLRGPRGGAARGGRSLRR